MLGGESLTLGRQPGPGGLRLSTDRASRRHCELRPEESLGVYRVVDLGSKNGTYLNGSRIEAEHLAGGSVLRVGGALFVYGELLLPDERTAPTVALGSSLERAWVEAHAARLARTGLPILIHGPTGAGKELLARRVHSESGREGPFVALNCATLNRELVGSELFGHVRGAYSGARDARKGIFVQAGGGTLFLDEVADLSPELQPALLRVLQEGMLRPVGADREVTVDVRVVAASHQSLDAEVAAGRFREDLMGRLAGATLELPGLARRRAEILGLFEEFLGSAVPPLTLEAAEALLLHDWPRNVRELQHAAAGVKVFRAEVSEVGLSLLPSAVQRSVSRAADGGVGVDSGPRDRPTRQALAGLLVAHEGNLSQVAREGGWHRMQVYRWLKALGLDAKDYRA